MKTRMIKPGFFLNEDLAECSFAARLLYAGFWLIADREGRIEYRPKKLKAEIFPYDNVDIEALTGELERFNFVLRYTVEGNQYLFLPTFTKHQHIHPKEAKSELPGPEMAVQEISGNSREFLGTPGKGEQGVDPGESDEFPGIPGNYTETDGLQETLGNSGIRDLSGNSRELPGTPGNSATITSTITSTFTSTPYVCTEPCRAAVPEDEEPASVPTDLPVFRLPLNRTGTFYNVYQAEIDENAPIFPGVNVALEFRKMVAWLEANPTRKKTAGGIKRFINSWLSRAQNSAGASSSSTGQKKKVSIDEYLGITEESKQAFKKLMESV